MAVDSVFELFEGREEFGSAEERMIFMGKFIKVFRQIAATGIPVFVSNEVISRPDPEGLGKALVPLMGDFWASLIKEKVLLRRKWRGKGSEADACTFEILNSQSVPPGRCLAFRTPGGFIGKYDEGEVPE